MRILLFAGGSAVYGMETVLLTLMRQLRRDGHECIALISGWNDGEFARRLTADAIPYVPIKLGRIYLSQPLWTIDTLGSFPKACFLLLSTIRRCRPDLIVHTDPFLFRLVRYFARAKAHVFYLHNLPAGTQWILQERYIMRMCTRIITVSEFVKSVLVQRGFSEDVISVVYNGISCPPYRRTERSSSNLHVGIVGQIIPRKRHRVLLYAVAAANLRNLNMTVSVYGDPHTPYAREMVALAKLLNIENQIRWLGYEPDRAIIYSSLDVLVAPAIEEPFGATLIEASAYGVPAIAARSGAFPEIIIHGESGLLFEPDDSTDLSEALIRIATDAKLRQRLGERARAIVKLRFTPEKMSREFVAAVNLASSQEDM